MCFYVVFASSSECYDYLSYHSFTSSVIVLTIHNVILTASYHSYCCYVFVYDDSSQQQQQQQQQQQEEQ